LSVIPEGNEGAKVTVKSWLAKVAKALAGPVKDATPFTAKGKVEGGSWYRSPSVPESDTTARLSEPRKDEAGV
jgi:hypothetical protein